MADSSESEDEPDALRAMAMTTGSVVRPREEADDMSALGLL